MTWPALFLAFLVSHVVGDYLLQTEWQARTKAGGLGRDPIARRALLSHLFTYTLAFAPALVWLGRGAGAAVALGAAALIALPHLAVDDGRLVRAYLRTVKRAREPVDARLQAAVDQSFHLILLWIVAVIVAG